MIGQYRKDVMKALESMLGKGYEISPYDRRDNSGSVLHGICIRRTGEDVAPVLYLEEIILYCISEKVPREHLPGVLLQIYRQEEVPQDIADGLNDLVKQRDLVRIKLVSHGANAEALESRPHRRFLDLAVVYYLDLEEHTGIKDATAEVTDQVAEDLGDHGRGTVPAGHGEAARWRMRGHGDSRHTPGCHGRGTGRRHPEDWTGAEGQGGHVRGTLPQAAFWGSLPAEHTVPAGNSREEGQRPAHLSQQHI